MISVLHVSTCVSHLKVTANVREFLGFFSSLGATTPIGDCILQPSSGF